MPIDSITSVVSLRPAVSMNLYSMPSIIIVSSIESLVVPGISETIALSSFKREFSKVDLPEFGFPTIATGIPFFRALPILKEPESLSVNPFTPEIIFLSLFLSANSTSSSPKSSSSSISEAKFSNSCLSILISEEKSPRI